MKTRIRFTTVLFTMALIVTLGALLITTVVSSGPSTRDPLDAESADRGTSALQHTLQPNGTAAWHAASCSQTDIQAAIDAASDGDIVLVPAGQCVWSTLVAHTPAVSISGKGITLQGAGIDQTVITDTSGTSWGESMLHVMGMEGHPFRITGFSFIEIIDSEESTTGISIQGDCKNFRIDHNSFVSEGANYTSVFVNGSTYGVIDHNDFYNGRVLVFDAIYGNESWQRPLSLGSA